MNVATSEPYFQIISGVIILAVAAWMLYRMRISHSHHHHHNHHHNHDHTHDHHHDHEDAHARAHEADIHKRFGNPNQRITNGQIMLFGLTGGLIPCPAAITVLLLCLQIKEISLGATLVLSFSIGLALTLVAVGVIAALSLRRARQSSPRFRTLMHKAPYLSALLMGAVGIYMITHGLFGLGIFG